MIILNEYETFVDEDGVMWDDEGQGSYVGTQYAGMHNYHRRINRSYQSSDDTIMYGDKEYIRVYKYYIAKGKSPGEAERIARAVYKRKRRESVVQETATAEFYQDWEGDFVRYRGRTLTLKQFATHAKNGDSDAVSILTAIRNKMKSLGYTKDLLTFIKTHLGADNERLDVVVKDGLERVAPNGQTYRDTKVVFDDTEIANPQKYIKLTKYSGDWI